MKKYLPITISIVVVAILIAGIYFGTRGERQYMIEKTPAKELMTAKQAYDLASAEAKKWQTDVQPVFWFFNFAQDLFTSIYLTTIFIFAMLILVNPPRACFGRCGVMFYE